VLAGVVLAILGYWLREVGVSTGTGLLDFLLMALFPIGLTMAVVPFVVLFVRRNNPR
jgi:hypothetical protein